MIIEKKSSLGEIRILPLEQSNWAAFENLMGEKGGCGGCWCMSFRLSTREFISNKHAGNKEKMHQLVRDQSATGLLGFWKEEAVAWIALAPREDYIKIEKSRTLKRIDEKPVWAITCFFIRKKYRKLGLSGIMVEAAIEYARSIGIAALEAYPVIPYSKNVPEPFLWVEILSTFEEAGFRIVRQNGKSKAMVRLDF